MNAPVTADSGRQRSVYRRLLLPVYVPSVLSSSSLQALLVLVPLYVLDTGGSASLAALLIGIRGVGMLLFDVPVGILLSRYGDRPVLLLGLLAMTASPLLFAVAPAPWLMALAAILSGTGFTAWMIGRQSYITELSASAERGRAIALLAGIMRMGGVIGPAAGAIVAQIFGYRAAFVILALALVVAMLLVAASTQNVRPQHETQLTHLARLSATVSAHRRIFIRGVLPSLGLQLMRSGRVLLIPLFGHFLGLDITAIGAIISMSAMVDAALFYPVGVVMDRFGRKWTGVPCLLLFAVSLAMLPFATGYQSLLAAALVAGLANGLGSGLLLTLGSDLAPASGRGEFLGIWRLIGDVGHSAGPLMLGVLIEVATLGTAALFAAGIGFLGAGVLYWLVDETLQRDDSS